MSFPRYPAYKPSGVEWLGEVPEHWDVKRVRRIFEIKKRIAGELGFDILSITQQGIKVRDPDSNDGQISMDYSKYQMVEPGDFAMNHMDLLTGYVDISKRIGVTSPDYRVFSVIDPNDSHPGFLLYVFQMGYRQKILYAYGQGSSQLGRWRLPTAEFQNWAIPFPSLNEQVCIATFLDRETIKIDALIAEQQRLIELLQEKRQAVISHAVTKGLNPNAPMKDSGVEWLGEVPEHWAVKKASWLFRTEKGKKAQELTQEYCATNEGPFPVFSGQTKDDGVMGSIDSYEFDAGDAGAILCTTVGAKAMSIRRITGRFSLSQNCMVISPKTEEVTPVFFEYGFQPLFKHERALIPDHMQPSFRMEDFNQFWVQLPPVEEQGKISKYLQQENEVSVELEAEISAAIDLLQERRSALISAAVTGQIDVRGLATEVEP
jgi:type I restriction enzyme S subunit